VRVTTTLLRVHVGIHNMEVRPRLSEKRVLRKTASSQGQLLTRIQRIT